MSSIGNKTILIVEDNPITRKVARVALAVEGFTILEAPDGQTALALMTAQPPDLILQDLLLPDTDGFDLVRQLRALPGGEGIPILVISGFLSKLEQARSLQVGFTDYLFKPVEPSQLVSTVKAYLHPVTGAASRPGAGRHVLVADDDPIQLKLQKVQLEHLGYRVSLALDGVEALERARESLPDAVVTDVLMPRLDGFRLCLALRQDPHLAPVPVILTSAVYTEEADRHLAEQVGANAFLSRSPDCREVADALFYRLGEAPESARPHAQLACADETTGPLGQLPLEEYTHRVIRQLEHQVSLSANLTRRLALLEAELGILARVLETLKTQPDAETIIGELLHRCLDAAGISRGAAYLLAPDGRLALEAQLGYAPEYQEGLQHFFGHSHILHQALEQGEPVDIRAPCSVLGELLKSADARSILVTPLTLGESRLGVLSLMSANRELGEDWLSFAKAVGGQIAEALELARTLSRLSRSEQRYRDLVHNLNAIVWEADVQTGRCTFISRRAEGILGYPLQRWLNEPGFWMRLIHPEDRDRVAAACELAITAGQSQPLEYRAEAADGRLVWIDDSISPVPIEKGTEPARQIRGVMVDVTARQRLKERDLQLRLARQIHQRLFPTCPLRVAGLDIGGVSYPAEDTGGDYFDYVIMPNNHLAVVVGDASGHGFGPALMMAQTRAYLRAFMQIKTDLSAIMARLNRVLVDDIEEDRFITLLLAQFDPQTRTLVYTSAGHPTGYVLGPDGQVKRDLPSLGCPLGILPDAEFPTSEPIALEPGDVVLLLTDGIGEARAPDDTAFGDERALDIARSYQSDTAAGIADNLYHAVRAFSHNLPQDDDLTAVVIKVLDEPN